MSDEKPAKRQPGRPRQTPETDRPYVGVNLSAELRKRLSEAATAANRSLSLEIRYRLETSFSRPEDTWTPRQRNTAIVLAEAHIRGGPAEVLHWLLTELDTYDANRRRLAFSAMQGVMATFLINRPELHTADHRQPEAVEPVQ